MAKSAAPKPVSHPAPRPGGPPKSGPLAQAIKTDAARAQSREPPRDAAGTDRGDKRRT